MCLLWTHYIMGISFFKEISYQNKKTYLSRMLIKLTDKMEMMKENASGRSTILNLMLSVEKRKIILFMFRASICSGIATQRSERQTLYFNNKSIAESRVEAIPALSNVVLIRKEPRLCNHR